MQKCQDLITLVVHTEDHALKLKEILEFHDIKVRLEDVVIDGLPPQHAPKKIRIPVSSLALGLKILESGEATAAPLALIKMTGMGNSLLIPVDFSPLSMLAVKVGFFIAEKFGVEPILLHSYIAPMFVPNETSMIDPMAEELEEQDAIEAADLRKVASAQLSKLKKKIQAAQLDGSLPDLKFSTTLLEGIPEQVIQEYCKENQPLMVVMATRGADKKGSDLVGSVTAEVIDATRTPVFTVPDNYVPKGIETIKRVGMFCTFTGFDVLTLRWLMRTFDYPAVEFFLIPTSDTPVHNSDSKIDEMCSYLGKMYPTAQFHRVSLDRGKFEERVKDVIEENALQLLIVPNKKSSAFSRFFRPTLAHRILFEKDIPLLVIPV